MEETIKNVNTTKVESSNDFVKEVAKYFINILDTNFKKGIIFKRKKNRRSQIFIFDNLLNYLLRIKI